MTTTNTPTGEELEPCEVCIDPETVTCFCACHNVMHCFDCAAKAHSRAAVAAPQRHYFCSCGGALTAEEYITHYFELGHDRGDAMAGFNDWWHREDYGDRDQAQRAWLAAIKWTTSSPATPSLIAEQEPVLPNAPETEPDRKCWASTSGEVCIDPRGCDDRGCQLYADKDHRGKCGRPTSRDIRAELIAAHSAATTPPTATAAREAAEEIAARVVEEWLEAHEGQFTFNVHLATDDLEKRIADAVANFPSAAPVEEQKVEKFATPDQFIDAYNAAAAAGNDSELSERTKRVRRLCRELH